MCMISALARSTYYDLNSTFTIDLWPNWCNVDRHRSHYHCPSTHECPFEMCYDVPPIRCKRENHSWAGCWGKFPMNLVIDTIDMRCDAPTEALSNWIIADTCNLYYTTKQQPQEQQSQQQHQQQTSHPTSEVLFITLPFVILGLFALFYKAP